MAAVYLASGQVASWLSVTIAVVIGAVVAVLGALATMSTLAIGDCSAPFSTTYTNPPGSLCSGFPWSYAVLMRPAAIEAVLAVGVQYTGNIGDDGWIHGVGYEIRLFPNWYDQTPATNRGDILAEYGGEYGLSVSGAVGIVTLQTLPVRPGEKITGKGGHPILLSGTPGMAFRFSEKGYSYMRWLVIRGSRGYNITLLASPGNFAYLQSNTITMLDTWRWD